VSVLRDLWPWPWPWAYRGCRPMWGPSCASLVAIQPFRTVFEILSFKVIWVTTLTFWGHVTSSVTWPMDSQYGVSYRWSIRTDRLSRTVIEILNIKCIGVTTLTFWGHVTSCVTWPLDSQYGISYWWSIRTDRLSRTVIEILSFKRIGVTWRHVWRDHWIRNMGFPIGGQLEPTVYLARLLRY